MSGEEKPTAVPLVEELLDRIYRLDKVHREEEGVRFR
jgi:hypothetical protein